MAVNSELYKVAYDTDGTTGPFAIPFPVRHDDSNAARDIVVYYRTALGVETDITSLCTIAGMNVTLGTAYAAGGKISIVRDPDLKQLSAYSYGTKFPADQFEADLDYQTFMTQKVYSETSRSLKIPITDNDVTMTLPNEDQRPNKFLAFDADGLPMASEGSGTPASTYMATVLDDETASDAQTTLGFSAYIKTLIDDETASDAQTTLGFSAYIKTLIDDETAATAQATLEVMSIATAIKRSIKLSKPVGELFYKGDYVAPKAFDSTAALDDDNMQEDIFFPAKCLDIQDTYEDLAVANWPKLVPKLRAQSFIYHEGLTGEVSAYELDSWAISSNVATLVLDNNAANVAMVTLIAEVKLAIDDYPTITIAATIGNIPAGTYRLTGCTAGARTITFACTADDAGTTANTSTVTFHPHKTIVATTARVYGAKAMALMSAGTSTHMSGGLRRSFMQGHNHSAGIGIAVSSPCVYGIDTSGMPGSATTILSAVAGTPDRQALTSSPKNDGANGTPRTGTETEPRSLTAHLYVWAGDYIAS